MGATERRLPDGWQMRIKRPNGRWSPWRYVRGYPLDDPRTILLNGRTHQYRPLYAELEPEPGNH